MSEEVGAKAVTFPYPMSPDEAFENWQRENGYEDLADAAPDEVDLYRLRGALAVYLETEGNGL